MPNFITPEECELIERECFLESGILARNRERTIAEALYLYGIQPFTELAFHVELFQGNSALVIYDCGTLNINRDEWDPLEGTADASRDLSNIQAMWAGLSIVRQSGLRVQVGEDMAVVMTIADMANPDLHHRWSWTITPGQIRSIFSFAPRCAILAPVFADLPPEDKNLPSPGKAMQAVTPPRIFVVQSVLFQGVSTCQNHDGAGLLRLATTLQSLVN